MINRERKYFRLRKTGKIKLNPYLQGWGKYHGIGTSGFFKFRYHDSFIEFIGRLFPHGIGEDRQVCIHVYALCESTHVVAATYINNTHSEVLWITQNRPTWVGKLHKPT